MGVPFNRTPEGLLDFRRFGGTLFQRTAFAGATTGQQLLYALDEQVRRWRRRRQDEQASPSAARRWSGSASSGTSSARPRRRRRAAAASSRRTCKSMEIAPLPRRRGGASPPAAGHHLRQARRSRVISTGTAAERRLPAGRVLRQRRVHPGPPDRDPRRRQAPPDLARACAAKAAASGCPKDRRTTRARRQGHPREASATTSSKRSTRATATSSRATSPRREIFVKCCHEGLGVFNRTGKNESRSTSTSRTSPKDCLDAEARAASSRSTRSSSGVDPHENPMKIFPAVHYSMGGLWVDYETAPTAARRRLAAQPGDQHPRPLRGRRGRLPVPRRQSPRRQLAALVHLRGHRGRAAIASRYVKNHDRGRVPPASSTVRAGASRADDLNRVAR